MAKPILSPEAPRRRSAAPGAPRSGATRPGVDSAQLDLPRGRDATELCPGFRACALIPTYNNPRTIERVTEQALAHLGHVIVVNDGSGSEGTSAVRALQRLSGVVVVHRSQNGGKGAAVKDGLRRARELGFSHALQVDADGQHDLDDMPRFLESARRAPQALVLGSPEFDESVPRSRLYGRRLTNFWCAVETGGRVIRDPMCGFRVYPIAPALKARARGNHMDFDPEVAVKMVWQRVPVVNLSTRVRYLTQAEGGVSNFRMLRDNLRISWMHTRLVFGALLRLLLLPLSRQQREPVSDPAWHRMPEAGNTWGIRFLAATCRRLGRAPARFFLWFIVAYYVLFHGSARRASRSYLKRVGARHGVWASYQHLLRFAQCALDRFFLLSGDLQHFRIERHGHELLVRLAAEGRGAILLGAHVGSFEALRALARDSDVRIHTLGYFDNTEKLNQELDRIGDNRQSSFVQLKPGEFQHLFEVKELVESGQFVAMLGDRATGGQSAEVEFLGNAAQFPLGPFAMAAALGCPVLVTLGLHFPPNRYELFCEPLLERIPKRREDPGATLVAAQAFAARLEHYCRLAPDNWFNFYDFWNESEQ